MPSANDHFLHAYEDGLQYLELLEAKVTPHAMKPDAGQTGETLHVAQVALIDQFSEMTRAVIKDLKLEKPEAELVLRRTLTALNRIERVRFLLENLLEAVKRDQSLQNCLLLYKDLGLIEVQVPKATEDTRASPWRSSVGAGKVLRALWGRLRQVATTVMEIAINAIKVIPKLVALKPKPSIGLSGPFPTFSLQFELEAESMTIHELFNDLKAGMFELGGI
jgi:hypothetical protein